MISVQFSSSRSKDYPHAVNLAASLPGYSTDKGYHYNELTIDQIMDNWITFNSLFSVAHLWAGFFLRSGDDEPCKTRTEKLYVVLFNLYQTLQNQGAQVRPTSWAPEIEGKRTNGILLNGDEIIKKIEKERLN